MNTETRKKVFYEIYSKIFLLIKQGMNAGKMKEEQFIKMVEHANKIKNKYGRDKLVVDLVDSILACMDSKEQIDD